MDFGNYPANNQPDFYEHRERINMQREEDLNKDQHLRNVPHTQAEHIASKRDKYLYYFYQVVWTLMIFGCTVFMLQCGYLEHVAHFVIPPKPEFPPEFIPIAISTEMPALRCFPVDSSILNNMTSRDKRVVDSMRYHMKKDDYESITAFHIGEPLCITLLRDIDGSILEMYNVEIRGFSVHNPVRRDEYSVACPNKKRHVTRAESITITYLNPKTQMHHVEVFRGKQAWALQAAVFYSHGKSICELEGSNADLGLNTLATDINSNAIIISQ